MSEYREGRGEQISPHLREMAGVEDAHVNEGNAGIDFRPRETSEGTSHEVSREIPEGSDALRGNGRRRVSILPSVLTEATTETPEAPATPEASEPEAHEPVEARHAAEPTEPETPDERSDRSNYEAHPSGPEETETPPETSTGGGSDVPPTDDPPETAQGGEFDEGDEGDDGDKSERNDPVLEGMREVARAKTEPTESVNEEKKDPVLDAVREAQVDSTIDEINAAAEREKQSETKKSTIPGPRTSPERGDTPTKDNDADADQPERSIHESALATPAGELVTEDTDTGTTDGSDQDVLADVDRVFEGMDAADMERDRTGETGDFADEISPGTQDTSDNSKQSGKVGLPSREEIDEALKRIRGESSPEAANTEGHETTDEGESPMDDPVGKMLDPFIKALEYGISPPSEAAANELAAKDSFHEDFAPVGDDEVVPGVDYDVPRPPGDTPEAQGTEETSDDPQAPKDMNVEAAKEYFRHADLPDAETMKRLADMMKAEAEQQRAQRENPDADDDGRNYLPSAQQSLDFIDEYRRQHPEETAPGTVLGERLNSMEASIYESFPHLRDGGDTPREADSEAAQEEEIAEWLNNAGPERPDIIPPEEDEFRRTEEWLKGIPPRNIDERPYLPSDDEVPPTNDNETPPEDDDPHNPPVVG